MFSAGKNIKQKNDKLLKIDIEKLYSAIKKPRDEVKNMIEQLRILISIDPNSYRSMKTNLPYIVPSIFNPPFRKTENFASSEHLILDFDHLSEYDMDPEELKNRLKKDSRIELMFISPSMNGLKVFFRVKEKIFDAAKYSLFYKNFSIEFAKEHQINGILDTVTSDVTRACFISVDENVFFNRDVKTIDMDDFADFDDIFTVKEVHNQMQKVIKEKQRIEKQTDIDVDIFKEIKNRLNPDLKQKQEIKRNTFVPLQLENIMEDVKKYIEEHKINIKEIISINYGKKIIVEFKENLAEINVFYGKRGFTVVRSPKTGTNKELMELLYKIVVDFFNQRIIN